MDCNWTSPTSGNLTWQVDNVYIFGDDDSENGSRLTINWDEFEKLPGDVVFASCIGEFYDKNGTWAGMSQVRKCLSNFEYLFADPRLIRRRLSYYMFQWKCRILQLFKRL